jgi:hypothetical protein
LRVTGKVLRRCYYVVAQHILLPDPADLAAVT